MQIRKLKEQFAKHTSKMESSKNHAEVKHLPANQQLMLEVEQQRHKAEIAELDLKEMKGNDRRLQRERTTLEKQIIIRDEMLEDTRVTLQKCKRSPPDPSHTHASHRHTHTHTHTHLSCAAFN